MSPDELTIQQKINKAKAQAYLGAYSSEKYDSAALDRRTLKDLEGERSLLTVWESQLSPQTPETQLTLQTMKTQLDAAIRKKQGK